MSRTELHIGKLRKIELKENQSVEDWCKERLAEEDVLELESYYADWKEALRGTVYNKYFIVKEQIFEVFDHKELEEGDIDEIKENPDGTYSFIMSFYNGGTCLSECIERSLTKLI